MRFFDAGACRFSFVWLLVSLTLAAAAPFAGAAPAPSAAAIARAGVPFVANLGQADSRVAFLARTFAGTVFVTRDGSIVYSLKSSGAGVAPSGWALAESFPGARLSPAGGRAGPARVSDFTGGEAKSRSSLPTWESVTLGEIAPGVTIELRATGTNVEKIFTLAPGADPAQVRVRIEGATGLALRGDGALAASTGLGELAFSMPIAFQDIHGERRDIPVRYTLASDGTSYGFAVEDYDRSLPLVIDPLIRSIYGGGNGTDSVRAILVHPGSGQIYVAGTTTSTNFPGSTGKTPILGTDAFVARYSSTLSNVQTAAYFGGDGNDSATAIAIMPSTGNIYIAGQTTSQSGLPNTTGTYGGGSSDAFIARFDGALGNVSAAYFGGLGADAATGLAVDSVAGEVVMVGFTSSVNLPAGSQGAGALGPQGNQDAFVARFSSSLGLLRVSYFGGGASDQANAVAIDPISSDVFIGGVTLSGDLAGAANGALFQPGGGTDGFVARFNSGLNTLKQSSYFGGTGSDEITAIGVHPFNGYVYVAGNTSSTDLRGRLTGQTSKGTGSDAFVARYYPELTGLQGVSYYGGAGNDFATGLAISASSGEVYVTGYSNSTVPGITSGIQTQNSGGNDGFVARFDAALAGVKQATMLGGLGTDFSYAIALNEAAVYIAGETASDSFPGVPVPASVTPPAPDGFVSALDTDLRGVASNPAAFSFKPVVNALPLSIQTSPPTQVTPTGPATVYVDGQTGSTWCASSTGSSCTCDLLPGNAFTAAPMTISAAVPYFVCVRHLTAAASNVITESTLHVGAVAATFRVGTGIVPGLGCTLDVDGNGAFDALTDGMLILRAMLGMTGTAATTGVIGTNATRTAWPAISGYLNLNCGTSFSTAP